MYNRSHASPLTTGANRLGTVVPASAGAVTKHAHCAKSAILDRNPSSVRLTFAPSTTDPTGSSPSGAGTPRMGTGGAGDSGARGIGGAPSGFGSFARGGGASASSSFVSDSVTAPTMSATSSSVRLTALSATGSPTPPRPFGTSTASLGFALVSPPATSSPFSNSATPLVISTLTSSSVIGTIFCFPVILSRCTLNARMESRSRRRRRCALTSKNARHAATAAYMAAPSTS
mmetsp:Transcript_9503/g.36987  ORF Transcript_9503/g.36987 Transcript_9503/m.36987 type:complete len:231 (+) Transcript_9503:945-1637(+)